MRVRACVCARYVCARVCVSVYAYVYAYVCVCTIITCIRRSIIRSFSPISPSYHTQHIHTPPPFLFSHLLLLPHHTYTLHPHTLYTFFFLPSIPPTTHRTYALHPHTLHPVSSPISSSYDTPHIRTPPSYTTPFILSHLPLLPHATHTHYPLFSILTPHTRYTLSSLPSPLLHIHYTLSSLLRSRVCE